MNSQKFYFLETRKVRYLRLSRGANFSSFKIIKTSRVAIWNFMHKGVFMTNVCSLSLFPRAVMKSIPKSGCVLLVQGWQLRSHFIPAHQMKRYKKRVSVWKVIPGIWDFIKVQCGIRETFYGIRDLIKIQGGIRETFYRIRDFTTTQEAGFAKLGHTMHDCEKYYFRESNDESSGGGGGYLG